jgi:quercetin dioxygenase-like cupin family protein
VRVHKTEKNGGMTMVKKSIKELKPYSAPGHYGMTAMRIHGKEETGAENFWVGLSTFLPGGGAEYAYEDNPLEKVYYVLEGEMTVTDKKGSKYVIHKDETISFAPNEGRYLINESNLPARMLVIINYPQA